MGAVLLITLFSVILFSVWYLNYIYQTHKLLKKHQREWDKIKKTIFDNSKLEDEYLRYIEKLYAERGYYGSCFPRK